MIYYYYYYYYFLPRYSVPEDLEITNKEKKNYNGCNGLAGSERAFIIIIIFTLGIYVPERV